MTEGFHISVLIVDDEPPAVERLATMVTSLNGFGVIGCESRPGRVIERCRRLRPDVVLMDVEMPGSNGIELAREMAALDVVPAIIFVTAHESYAVEAFGVAAVDYLVKPVRQARLLSALDRVIAVRNSSRNAEQPQLAAKIGERLIRIAVDEIRAFTAQNKCTVVHSVSGRAMIDEPLKTIEQRFGSRFLRVHRNALISRRHVRSLFNDSDRIERVEIDGIELTPEVSRRNRSSVKELLRR
ncbi:MAG: LytTR family DNA-binding domain-containing protein [Wenzhouxiangellaceae bacterium]|nr:LytTR family DNA-binding domain-containing protein [Wenzhouxiangellaceae bacterium]